MQHNGIKLLSQQTEKEIRLDQSVWFTFAEQVAPAGAPCSAKVKIQGEQEEGSSPEPEQTQHPKNGKEDGPPGGRAGGKMIQQPLSVGGVEADSSTKKCRKGTSSRSRSSRLSGKKQVLTVIGTGADGIWGSGCFGGG